MSMLPLVPLTLQQKPLIFNVPWTDIKLLAHGNVSRFSNVLSHGFMVIFLDARQRKKPNLRIFERKKSTLELWTRVFCF